MEMRRILSPAGEGILTSKSYSFFPSCPNDEGVGLIETLIPTFFPSLNDEDEREGEALEEDRREKGPEFEVVDQRGKDASKAPEPVYEARSAQSWSSNLQSIVGFECPDDPMMLSSEKSKELGLAENENGAGRGMFAAGVVVVVGDRRDNEIKRTVMSATPLPVFFDEGIGEGEGDGDCEREEDDLSSSTSFLSADSRAAAASRRLLSSATSELEDEAPSLDFDEEERVEDSDCNWFRERRRWEFSFSSSWTRLFLAY
jgi:hypothetical protein